jgi:hypothetical protein
MFVLKILLLKLGIKEVVWRKIVANFQILGCRKNILSIFVALLTFYNKEKNEENITF